jgi:hypothetical protein
MLGSAQKCVEWRCLINVDEKAPCAGIFKQSMGARNQVGIVLSYRTARLQWLAELIFFESIPGLLKSLKIRALKETAEKENERKSRH